MLNERELALHVSGHACQEELKIIHALVKPKFFIPVHGEQRMLQTHAKLAREMGMDSNHILISDIGRVMELSVIATALKNPNITRVLGAEHGIKGVLNDRLFDMGQEDPAELELLKYTPSSALGSCRYKMADPDVDDTDYKRILEIFKKYDVRYFFYTAATTPWTPATRSPSICRRSATTAA